MLKLLIDHQTFSLQSYGGISRYFANIHYTAQSRPDITSEISLLYTKNHYLKDSPFPLNNALGKLILKDSSRCYKWNKQYSKYLIGKGNFDILHPSYYNPYFIKYAKKPVVITVHDMIHERLPEYLHPGDNYVRYKRLCIENAAHIIAISETTKRDLREFLNIEESRITVVHHGFQMNGISSSDQKEKTSTPYSEAEYLLFVGNRSSYKNFPTFLTAVSSLLHAEKKLKVYCAGGGAFEVAEQEQILRLKLEDKIVQLNPTDDQLTNLYQNARAFIFPSLYEGFGLPILEAFKNNCPVIASDHACFREIGGDAIAYFNPHDPHSILKAIQDSITNSTVSAHLIKNGQHQLRKFTIETCMDKTMAVYSNLVQ